MTKYNVTNESRIAKSADTPNLTSLTRGILAHVHFFFVYAL